MVELIVYFIAIALITAYAKKKTSKEPEDYFLAKRSFGSFILFFTLAATNFSAFTFLGFAGKAYTDGLAQYGIMALGTSFMAIMFYVLGKKIWKIGKEKKYTTPAELIAGRYNSRALQILIMLIMTIFTIPYLAIQAIRAEYILNTAYSIDMKIGANSSDVNRMFICAFWRNESYRMDRCFARSNNDFCYASGFSFCCL